MGFINVFSEELKKLAAEMTPERFMRSAMLGYQAAGDPSFGQRLGLERQSMLYDKFSEGIEVETKA